MNFLFLVEGEKTETIVYQAWLSHIFPELNFVKKPENLTGNSCRIIAGKGYPSMVSVPKVYGGRSRLEACLLDIDQYKNVDYFFICIDSEEQTYQERFDEIERIIEGSKKRLGMTEFENTKTFIIIQHCCFETWGLGNSEIPQKYTSTGRSSHYNSFIDHYNILTQDPELMPKCSEDIEPSISRKDCSTRARFHKKYLKEYFREFGFPYKESNPSIIVNKDYLNALKQRCLSSGHLSSFKKLIDIWDKIRANASSQDKTLI
jgi:hypothetical protein